MVHQHTIFYSTKPFTFTKSHEHRERWGFSKRHSNRLIEAANVVIEMGPTGPTPNSERQARELARIKDEEERREQVIVGVH